MVRVPTLALHLHYLIFQHSVSKLIFFPRMRLQFPPIDHGQRRELKQRFYSRNNGPLMCCVVLSVNEPAGEMQAFPQAVLYLSQVNLHIRLTAWIPAGRKKGGKA